MSHLLHFTFTVCDVWRSGVTLGCCSHLSLLDIYLGNMCEALTLCEYSLSCCLAYRSPVSFLYTSHCSGISIRLFITLWKESVHVNRTSICLYMTNNVATSSCLAVCKRPQLTFSGFKVQVSACVNSYFEVTSTDFRADTSSAWCSKLSEVLNDLSSVEWRVINTVHSGHYNTEAQITPDKEKTRGCSWHTRISFNTYFCLLFAISVN